MASKRDIKKDLNFVICDIIEAVYLWELSNPKASTKESETIIDDAIDLFNKLIKKVNQKDHDNAKSHFNTIYSELEEGAKGLVSRINKL